VLRDIIECKSHRGYFWLDGTGRCKKCGDTAGISVGAADEKGSENTSVDATLSERGKRYGDLTDNAPVHELLPCPFCGSAPCSDEDDSHSTAWEIKCSCGAAPYVWERTKAEAVIAWNTRTAPDLAAHP